MREPMTLDDYLKSRWVAEPLRLLDCCSNAAGGGACIVTSIERARDVAIVELVEGPRLHTKLVDCRDDEIRIGMPVEVVFDRINDEVTLPKFRPAGIDVSADTG
jgi:acetyl-CoA acetyltransferase